MFFFWISKNTNFNFKSAISNVMDVGAICLFRPTTVNIPEQTRRLDDDYVSLPPWIN
jgi:hypothetical protein